MYARQKSADTKSGSKSRFYAHIHFIMRIYIANYGSVPFQFSIQSLSVACFFFSFFFRIGTLSEHLQMSVWFQV